MYYILNSSCPLYRLSQSLTESLLRARGLTHGINGTSARINVFNVFLKALEKKTTVITDIL